MSVIATTNTQHYENIADGLRTAGDLSNYKSETTIEINCLAKLFSLIL